MQEKGNVLKLPFKWPHLIKVFVVRFKCFRVTYKAGVMIKSTLKLYTDGLSILTIVHKLESPCARETVRWTLRTIVVITFIVACCCCAFERCAAVDFLG